MKFRYSYFAFFFLLLSGFTSFSQTKPPSIEGWRVHTSFASNNDLCEAGSSIYVASNNALFTYKEQENEVEIISRATGLSDVTATKIAFDNQTGIMVIIYDNANIDLIKEDKVTNLPEIMNQVIIGNKIINNICIYQSKAYLACSFGIVVIDLAKKRIADSYTNLGTGGANIPISDVAIINGTIYFTSTPGIFKASLTSNNLSDYNTWQLTTPSTFSNELEVFNEKLYGVIDSTLKVFNGTSWDTIAGFPPLTIYHLKQSNHKLVISDRLKTSILSTNNSRQDIPVVSDKGGIIGSDGKLYTPVDNQYLLAVNLTTNQIDYIGPPGPQGSSAIKMASKDKNVWVAGGSVTGFATSSGWNSPKYSSNKFYRFNNNEWFNYNQMASPIISGPGDFVDVAIHPDNHHAFFANFGTGLIEMNESAVVANYDTTNSSLQKFNTGSNYRPLMVSGVAFDEDNNLWVSNYGAPFPLSVRSAGNQWYSYPVPSGVDNRLVHLTCDDYGNKWIINTRNSGILVFNENKTLSNKADDQYKVITEAKQSGLLPSTSVFCITKDLNGTLWTGTLKGLCIFNNPENVFEPNADYDAQQIVIKTGLIYSNFLGDVPVYSIAVDAGNRKWIGTAQGVWLVSPDGYTVIKNFTTANSPLLSNTVYSIGINESTGEVFFGTEKGMCSYMGTASVGTEDQKDVFIFPNPVRPDYTGLIAIRGLITDAYVKITDVHGNLVYETKANGGMATWNGMTMSGKRAATGVYLIYSATEEGKDTWVGKVVMVN